MKSSYVNIIFKGIEVNELEQIEITLKRDLMERSEKLNGIFVYWYVNLFTIHAFLLSFLSGMNHDYL